MHRSLRAAGLPLLLLRRISATSSAVLLGVTVVACSSSPTGDGAVAFGPGAPAGIYGPGDALGVGDAAGPGDVSAPDGAQQSRLVCLPCVDAEDCEAGACLAIDGVRLCLDRCADDGSCVGGLSCVGAEGGDVCAPTGGVCPCDFATRGQVRRCAGESETGICVGEAVCDFVDGWTCSVRPPAPEECNLADDDCDGEVDEDYKLGGYYFGPESCGECGVACADVPHGTAACSLETPPAACRVVSCDPGYVSHDGLTCELTGGLACVPCTFDAGCPGGACEVVDGVGMCLPACGAGCAAGYTCDDADGLCWPTSGTCACRPESVGLVVSCTQDNAFGSCVGISTCQETGFSPCDAAVPAAEDCNGLDDDCDGVADEALPPDQTCVATTEGVGSCVGLLICAGAEGWRCTAEAPTPEVCDTLDNDCDGAVDDGFRDPVTGLYTTDAHCGACGIDCALLVAPHALGHCAPTAPLPTCGLACEAGWVDADGDDGNGCECPYMGADDPPDGVDQNCDGIDGMPDKAVFVSVTGSDAAPGTPKQPVRSVARGLELAKQLGRPHVYVTGGQFEGGANIHAGARVFCGFDLLFSARQPAANESVLLAPQVTAVAPGTVNAVFPSPPSAPTGMDGCTVIGGTATGEGAASYAIYVRNGGPQVSFTGNRVVAGVGGPGASGLDGAHGDDGVAGIGGKDAYDVGGVCVAASALAGGAGGARTCGGTDVSGGLGGQSVCPDYNEFAGASDCPAFDSQSPKGGETGKVGLPGGLGGGGGLPGGDALQSVLYDGKTCTWDTFNCGYCHVVLGGTDGKDGKQGTAGEQGAAGPGAKSALGVVKDGLWSGAVGSGGGSGKAGAGGGGGGAGGGVETYSCQDATGGSDVGGSGGGGGSGGCGGSGGTGGGAGGAAFGIFLAFTSAPVALPVIAGNTLVTGKGGSGGKGGAGGVGGVGGYGGWGGADGAGNTTVWCAGEGGTGGHGGSGGSGGGGGGGAGGPSIGVAVHAPAGTVTKGIEQNNTFQLTGASGAAGAGGASKGKPGVAGPAGQHAGVALLPL